MFIFFNRRENPGLKRKIFVKKEEIDAIVLKVTGLDFDQFCRTTMLAQGEFTKFLKSSDAEKTGILEKLTGTGIYSEIGRQIYAVYKEKDDRNWCIHLWK